MNKYYLSPMYFNAWFLGLAAPLFTLFAYSLVERRLSMEYKSLYFLFFPILWHIIWYFMHDKVYFSLSEDSIEKKEIFKFACNKINYKEIEYIYDDKTAGIGPNFLPTDPEFFLLGKRLKGIARLYIYTKDRGQGKMRDKIVVPYTLENFDEFLRELIKRSPNIKCVAPSIQKYLATGKMHKIDNTGIDLSVEMPKSYIEKYYEMQDKQKSKKQKINLN